MAGLAAIVAGSREDGPVVISSRTVSACSVLFDEICGLHLPNTLLFEVVPLGKRDSTIGFSQIVGYLVVFPIDWEGSEEEVQSLDDVLLADVCCRA